MYRSFLNRAYPTMKKHNPHTPILVREAAGTLPRVYARYGMKSVQQRFNGDILTRWTDLGREKQEVLLGKWFGFITTRDVTNMWVAGLSDQQIEEKLTGLVKESS